jgi:hypothetical protein
VENIYEQFFFLKYSGGWSFAEAYNLPVGLRRWFVARLVRQLEAESDAIESASQGGNNSNTHTLTTFNQPTTPTEY